MAKLRLNSFARLVKYSAGLLLTVIFLSNCMNQTPVDYQAGSRTFESADFFPIFNQVISVFENNSPVRQYGYIENLSDGRGYTAGRAGFTTATGDFLEVVERYTRVRSSNNLAPYLDELRWLADMESGQVTRLPGIVHAWQTEADDALFQRIQDELVDDYYYAPAMNYATQFGLVLPLTRLALADAAIQHGNGEDADSLYAMLTKTNDNLGGAPSDGFDEVRWLTEFLAVRKVILLHPNNSETQTVWVESVGRVTALQTLLDLNNLYFKTPFIINPWGDTFTIE